MKLLVLNGPNLNLLGWREPEVYGCASLNALEKSIRQFVDETYNEPRGDKNAIELKFYQSNHEGHLINALHNAYRSCHGVVYNPAAHTHYSYALRDAIAAISIPVIEVHLSDIDAREEFRKKSVMSEVCLAQFKGEGATSYHKAVAYLIEHLEGAQL
ncbi:MAG: type II 3-dehydroquinate dehydratase [Coriobacteriia bacterium]|jgi:3-dehydroquinate dehydratase-2|nr:type II 3-dehydroquinate dehydratase [Coriobacteriia bacterium]MDR2715033.1 type II 3-dehydroquinate dehydratase [Coriobacteriales bacterium]